MLSTCNRTEVYAVAERFHGAYADIRDFFCELGGLAADELHPHLYSQHDDAAVTHLFEVAAGLDSAVLGESEILGQVRGAWELAQDEGGAKATLEPAVPPCASRPASGPARRRRSAAARRRSATPRSRWRPSASVRWPVGACWSSAPARWAKGIAVALVHAGATEIVVTNRTVDRAAQLAERVGGTVVPFTDLTPRLADSRRLVDLHRRRQHAGRRRTGQIGTRSSPTAPLLIVDIAVPRDVDPDVVQLPDVTLLDLDDLRDWAGAGDAAACRRSCIVSREHRRPKRSSGSVWRPRPARRRRWSPSSVSAPRSSARPRSSGSPLGWPRSTMPQRATLSRQSPRASSPSCCTPPSVRLKDDAGTPQGERNAATVRDLFDLG